MLQNSEKIEIKITGDAAFEIAKRARGTPRIAKRLLRRTRDFVQVHGNEKGIDLDLARQALDFLNVDASGFDTLDQKIIRILVKDFQGGPVGLETLAAAAGEDKQTLQDFCEPYLIRIGLLQKTPKGRKISAGKRITLEDKKIIIEDIAAQQELF